MATQSLDRYSLGAAHHVFGIDIAHGLVGCGLGRACMEQMQQYGADGTPCGAHLFNLARGGIVVEEDAAACLEEGTLATYSAAAGRDEPPGPS